MGILGLFMLGLAWLVPNKAFPWLSIWNESVAIGGGILLWVASFTIGGKRQHVWHLSWPLAACIGLGITAAWIQWSTGLLSYAGDAWMVTLYLSIFLLSALTGHNLANSEESKSWTTGLLMVILLTGLVSAGIIFMQWLWATPYIVFAQEMVSSSRPFANLGQPNHANTLFFLAACCALQLRRDQIIGAFGTVLALSTLALAMGVTQSRTGILQVLILAAGTFWIDQRQQVRKEKLWGLFLLTLAILNWWLVPWLEKWLLLPGPERDIVASTTSDLRFRIWAAFTEAANLRPWTGYGWLQTGWAQESIAACHPGLRYFFNYTHFLPLDLIVWLGFPLGIFLTMLLGWWLAGHLFPRNSAALSGYWLLAILGLSAHALLEYPLAYAYFLIPAGLFMGIIDAKTSTHRSVALSSSHTILIWTFITILSLIAGYDAYRSMVTNTRLRFENLRIGTPQITTVPPSLLILDQAYASLKLLSFEVNDPVSATEIEEVRKIVEHSPAPSSLMRYALILGFSGRHEDAARQQQLLCDIYSASDCEAGKRRWIEWQNRFPDHLIDFKGRTLPPRCDKRELH